MLAMLRWMSSSDHSFVVALSKSDPSYALFGESQFIHAVYWKLQLVFCLIFFQDTVWHLCYCVFGIKRGLSIYDWVAVKLFDDTETLTLKLKTVFFHFGISL